MRRKMFCTLVVVALFLAATSAFASEERGTKKEAEALVKKAVAHYVKNGDKALPDFTAPNTSFVDKDIYILAYDFSGICLANGRNEKQVGKNLMEFKDKDGKAFVKERVELAKTKKSFWHEYIGKDPLTKQYRLKQTYCENAMDKVIICAGIYK